MIEIGHHQAERLIRRQIDLLLSDEEWIALQIHLEHCPDCRTLQHRLQCSEPKIRQSLRARWDPVAGPSGGLPQSVSKISKERDTRRIKQSTVAIYVAVITVIFLFAVVQGRHSGMQEVIPETGGNGETQTPTNSLTPSPAKIQMILPGQFPHIIAYESHVEGNSEIFLLNPGFSPVNLTQNPAEDTFPTWSPDGEWLAFLSNRATRDQKDNKNELYVISIAGNRLVQMTSETRIDWDGPLSWSADGKWIAVEGMLLDESRQRSIYVVGVNGSGPRLLPDTQGGVSPKFAPYGDRIAFYQAEGSLNRIVIYHIDSGLFTYENLPRANQDPSAMDVAFDWPADGDGLYYTIAPKSTRFINSTSGPNCLRMVVQPIPNKEAWHEKLRNHFHIVGREITGRVHSVSWAPKELVIYSIDFQGQENGMFNNKFNQANFLADMCVQSGLDRGSWSLDMHWLAFTAYERDVKDAGLYAVRMPGLDLDWQLSGTDSIQSAAIRAGTIFRLSSDNLESSLPRMRPFRANMNIEPHPAQTGIIRTDTFP